MPVLPFIFASSLHATELNTTAVNIGIKDMFNAAGKVVEIPWSTGQRDTRAALLAAAGATSFSGLTGSATASQLPALSGLNGSVTANQIPEIDLTSATSTTGMTSQQVAVGSSSGQIVSFPDFNYNPLTFTLTVPKIVVGTSATMPADENLPGSKTTTAAPNYDITDVVQGTGKRRFTGSGSVSLETDLGTNLGTVTAGSNIARLVFVDAVGTSGNYTNPVKVVEGTISANNLGINGYIKAEIFASFPSNSSTKNLSLRIGETLIYGTQTSTTGNLCRLTYEVQNTGVTGTQTGTHPTHNNGFITSSFGSQTYNFDTTATQTVKVYMQTTGTETMKLHWFRLWVTTIN